MAEIKKYDWKKTFGKFAWALGEIVVAGAVVYFTDNNIFLVIVPVLEGLRNYIKHRKD